MPSFSILSLAKAFASFCPLRKQVVLTKHRENDNLRSFYPHKQGALLLRPRKPTKTTKMAGVTQARWPFARGSSVRKFPKTPLFYSIFWQIRPLTLGGGVVNLPPPNPVSPNPLNLRGADSPPKFRGRPSKKHFKTRGFWTLRPLNLGAESAPLKFRGLG